MSIQWPLDTVNVTGEWANSPWYYQQFGQIGHNGIDLAAAVGTPVYATDSGTIVAEGWGNYDNWMGSIAGIFVRIGHSWGFSAYAHLSNTIVNVGQWVNRGQLIGYSGATGVGTGPHLHFETFPPSPNFGNGFAGRVSPRSWGLVARGSSSGGSTSKPTPKASATVRRATLLRNRENNMIYIYQLDKSAPAGIKFAVFVLGQKGTWWEFTGQSSANQLAGQRGNAMQVAPGTWSALKTRHK